MDTINFALRIDLDGVTPQDVLGLVGGVASNYLVVREGGDENPHVHVFGRTDKKLSAVRKAVQRFLSGDRGNASYSLKQCAEDYDGYLRYLCKGDSSSKLPEVLGRCGLEYTDDWVKQMHSAYWLNNEEIVKSRQKRKRIQTATVVEKLEERCKEAGVLWNQPEKIALEYIRMCKASKKPINVFAARAIVNTVKVVLDPGSEAEKELAALIAPPQMFNV